MAKKLRSDLERIASKYLVDAVTGCWVWQGRLDKDGYGARVKIGSRIDGTRKFIGPHRFMYESLIGAIDVGLVPDHLCRNRACGNPWHMEPVTRLINHQRGLRARRTHCRNGHEISGWNEIVRSDVKGHRCRICRNAFQAAYQKSIGHRHSKAYKARKKSATATS